MSYHPTKNDTEELEQTVRELKDALFQFLGPRLELTLVGSTAKGTWLKGEADIDIYVIHKTLPENTVWNKLRVAFPEGRVKEGHLKIWNLRIRKFDVDLVLPLKGKREDTILHADYYNRKLTNHMRAEIRTAKAYFKSKGVYGAEIGGIIGVAIEQLVILEKDFKAVCMLLRGPRPFVQDPTMTEERDLLASVTPKRWKQIQQASWNYLANPNFEYRIMNTTQFMTEHPNYSTIMFKRLRDRALDFQTISSVAEKTGRILRNQEPEVEVDFDAYIDGERIVLCYKVTPVELTETKTRCIDPRIVRPDEVAVFLEEHPVNYNIRGMICTEVPRNIRYPETYYYAQVVSRMMAREYEQI